MSSIREPVRGAAADRIHYQMCAPSDLEVAIRVAQQLLDSDQILSLREALRLLLRALDAEPATDEERARQFVARHFPATTALLAAERGERP